MKMNFDTTFGPQYEATVLNDPSDSDAPLYGFPGAVRDLIMMGSYIEASTKYSKRWVGCFSAGKLSPNALSFLACHPDPARICVVTKGEGFIVNANDPTDWMEIPLRPIMGAVVVPQAALLVFHDFVRVVAFNSKGIAWRTRSVSWDGIKNMRLAEDSINAEVWDAPIGKFVPVSILASNGEVSGGASPPLRD